MLTPKYVVDTLEKIEPVLNTLRTMLKKGVESGPVIVTLSRESKRRIQEKKYHALIADFVPVVMDVEGVGPRTYSKEVWKAQLIREFDLEMKAQGTPLQKPGIRVVTFDAMELMYVRPTSTEFSLQEARDFVEFLNARGTELAVKWSDKALAVYSEYRGAS